MCVWAYTLTGIIIIHPSPKKEKLHFFTRFDEEQSIMEHLTYYQAIQAVRPYTRQNGFRTRLRFCVEYHHVSACEHMFANVLLMVQRAENLAGGAELGDAAVDYPDYPELGDALLDEPQRFPHAFVGLLVAVVAVVAFYVGRRSRNDAYQYV